MRKAQACNRFQKENWKIGEDHLGEKGLDWKLEKVYTEDPKPLKTEEPEYKPQACRPSRV